MVGYRNHVDPMSAEMASRNLQILVSSLLDNLPKRERKLFAAFYTNSAAADLLTGLTIDKWDSSVIDPACGAGSLLTAAYDRKMDLFKEQLARKNSTQKEMDKLHRLFIEKHITGIELMPLAARAAAVRLTLRRPQARPNKVRVAICDSLELSERVAELTAEGIEIRGISKSALESFDRERELALVDENNPEVGEQRFHLSQHDVLIMNPPFTDRKKMPLKYREKLGKFDKIASKCGRQVNLWGSFLALADELVKKGGRIGAVIPINIGRGKATEKIREFILDNYRILYIVKPTKNVAFSEAAAFRDILLIMEKAKPRDNDKITFVLLKKSLEELKNNQTRLLVDKIRWTRENICEIFSCESLEVMSIKYRELRQRNLMELIWGFSAQNMKLIDGFIGLVRARSRNKLINFPTNQMMEGFHTSPDKLSQVLFITDPCNRSRIGRSSLVFVAKDGERLFFRLKATERILKVPINSLEKGLKTIVGLRTIDITDLNDYIIVKPPDKEILGRIIKVSKYGMKRIPWKKIERERKKKTHVTVFRRFSPTSRNTHFLSVYSESDFIPTDAFKIFRAPKNESKIVCLFLNSLISIVKLLQNMQQTTGPFIDIKEEDFENFDFINLQSLNEREIASLLLLFERLKGVEFPSILEQLEKAFWGRIELDRTLLRILGFTDNEINKWLPRVYKAIIDELKTLKSIH
ncbi:MAG: N-6 DNA methylase [Candidatus Hodarchaeota archaeon]